MTAYRKVPVEIQAWPIADLVKSAERDWPSLPTAVRTAYGKGGVVFTSRGMYVPTLEGSMFGDIASYLIEGVQGELYPCKPDIFKATYELAVGV